LGVGAILIFQQKSGEAFRINDKSFSRWERLVRESAKQCKRCWLPQIQAFDNLVTLLCDEPISDSEEKVFCDLDGERSAVSLKEKSGNSVVIIGNEHGFCDEEIDILKKSGFKPVRISDGVLTAYTAAIAAASIWGYRSDCSS
jgi:16S rRNA (uracil1498-N3)-methyltransferase